MTPDSIRMNRPRPMKTTGTSQCSTRSSVSVTALWVPISRPAAHQTATRIRNTTIMIATSPGGAGAEDRRVEGDVVRPVGDGDPRYAPQPDRSDLVVVVIVVSVAAQAAHEGPDADAERDQAEEPDPFVRDDRQAEGGDHADHDQGDEPEVLARDDLPGSWAPAPGGEEENGEHDDVVDVGRREQTDRGADGREHQLSNRGGVRVRAARSPLRITMTSAISWTRTTAARPRTRTGRAGAAR